MSKPTKNERPFSPDFQLTGVQRAMGVYLAQQQKESMRMATE